MASAATSAATTASRHLWAGPSPHAGASPCAIPLSTFYAHDGSIWDAPANARHARALQSSCGWAPSPRSTCNRPKCRSGHTSHTFTFGNSCFMGSPVQYWASHQIGAKRRSTFFSLPIADSSDLHRCIVQHVTTSSCPTEM